MKSSREEIHVKLFYRIVS